MGSKNLSSCRQNLPTKGQSIKKLNKAFAKKKTTKEKTVLIYDTLDSNYSSSSEDDNPPDEY